MGPVVAILEALLEWLEPFFGGGYGYVIVAVAILLERIILIGYFVPGETIMVLGVVLATQDVLSVVGIIAVAGLASLAGESLGFLLGRRVGPPLVKRLPLADRLEKRVAESRELFDRHGGKAVAVGRYAAGGGSTVPFVAGMVEMPYTRFFLFNAPAVAVWAVAFGLLGYLLGENLELLDEWLRGFGWVAVILAGLMAIGYITWRRRRKGRVE